MSSKSHGFSRRDLFVAATALGVPVRSPGTPPNEAALRLCQRWCEIDRESRSLILRWQRLETWLFRHRSWPALTPEQQAGVPEAAPLGEIDERLDALEAERSCLLPEIQATPAVSRDALILKLEVATQLFAADEQPEARGLLRSVRDDLLRLWA